MQHHTTIIVGAIIASAGSFANADITRVNEFSSDQFESFEHLSMNSFDRGDVSAFDTMGTLFSTGDSAWARA